MFKYIGKITGVKAMAIAEHNGVPTINLVKVQAPLCALYNKGFNYNDPEEQLPEQDCHKISLLAVGFSS
jgi:hypothetical protein